MPFNNKLLYDKDFLSDLGGLPKPEREKAIVNGKFDDQEKSFLVDLYGLPENERQKAINGIATPPPQKTRKQDPFGLTKRALGVTVGTMNAPTAFIWGSQNAKFEGDINQYRKMPKWKQALVDIGGGFNSAWESMTKEGEWGTRYGEFYKNAVGETIEESLPSKLKWAAPTLEIMAEMISTPSVSFGMTQAAGKAGMFGKAMKIKAFNFEDTIKLAQNFTTEKKTIEALNDSANRIAKLSKQQKAKLQNELAGVVKVAKQGGKEDNIINLWEKNLIVPEKTPNFIPPDTAWAKVAKSIGTEKKGNVLKESWDRLVVKGFDRFAPIYKKSPKAYQEARQFNSYKDVANIKFDELADGLKPVKQSEKHFTHYLLAHRDLTRAQRGLKNPNGVTLEDAQKAITQIETDYAQKYGDISELKGALNSFKQWSTKYILQDGVESGVISTKAADRMLAKNEWYATFDVLEKMPQMDDIPSNLLSKEYFNLGRQEIFKEMKGTEKLIRNPIEATVRKFAQAQQTYARNRVANALIDDPNMEGFFVKVAKNKKQLTELKKKGVDSILEGLWDKRKFDTIARFKDGVAEKFVVEKELADSMKQLTPKQANKFIHAVTGVFRKAATQVYLPFTISNIQRDALMAYTTSPVYRGRDVAQFAGDWAGGLKEGLRHEFLGSSDIVQTYLKNGGGFGYVGSLREQSLVRKTLFKKGFPQKVWSFVKSPLDLIEKISASAELAPRLAVYKRGMKQGYLARDAAYLGRKSTIDFNRAGTFTRAVNQWVPFLNARMQGRMTVAQAVATNPKNFVPKVFASVVIPGMATYAWNRLYYSDLYDDIPEDVKQNYFTMITDVDTDDDGNVVPKFFLISKGDIGQVAWNPIEFGLDQKMKENPQEAKKFLINYLNDISFVDIARDGELSGSKIASSVLPPIIKAPIEHITNKKFYQGRPLVSRGQERKPPELQYTDRTPDIYKKIGSELEVSPLIIQNYAQNIIAGYGREGLSLGAMLRGLTGRVVRSQGGQIESEAWDEINDIQEGYESIRAYAQEFVKNGDRATAIRLMNLWNDSLNNKIEVYNDKFAQKMNGKLKEKGGLRKSFTFTTRKRKNILLTKDDPRTYIEKKLSP